MIRKKPLDFIDFDSYEFDAEKGLIWSKFWKRWLTGRKSYIKGNKDDYYLTVELKNKDGTKDFYPYHRVLGYLFVEKPEEYKNIPYELLEINHINENKHDNRVVNLEWCDRGRNVNFGTGNKRRSETNKKVKHTDEWNKKVAKALSVPIIRVLDDGTIEEYEGITIATKILNINSPGLICNCCQDKNHPEKNLKSHRRAYKSEWYYKEDYEKMLAEQSC